MTQHPPGYEGPGTYYQCPICGHLIKQVELSPEAVMGVRFEVPPGGNPVDALTEAVGRLSAQADDAQTLAHYELEHTLPEVLSVMSRALRALDGIHDQVNTIENWTSQASMLDGLLAIDNLVHRGLGIE